LGQEHPTFLFPVGFFSPKEESDAQPQQFQPEYQLFTPLSQRYDFQA